MNVLSLFDGMSCGQIALERAAIRVNNYYASELDKYAIKVTQTNYPNTHQLGDVTKWKEWDIDWASTDLLIGGSPCQGFSFAGKQLAFDDPRSKLFFVYVDILDHIRSMNPEVKFMLENVKMKQEYMNVISQQLGVEPVFINSALVSAQNRQRYYWANWEFGQPEDRGVTLNDIIEESIMYSPAAVVGRKLNAQGKRDDTLQIKTSQYLEVGTSSKSRCLSTVCKDTVISSLPPGRYPVNRTGLIFLGGFSQRVRLDDGKFLSRNFREGGRIYDTDGKACTLTSQSKGAEGGYSGLYGKVALNKIHYRNLSPLECERLQTVPDNYTNHVSNTQRYKMLGNGWTVDVVTHILKHLKIKKED